jgi:hypothetical protein
MTRSAPTASELRRNLTALLVIGSIVWLGLYDAAAPSTKPK